MIELTPGMKTRATLNGLTEIEVSHFEQLLTMPNMISEEKINAGILGLKAAGLNPDLRADGTFGPQVNLACDAFEDMDTDDKINVNLALAGLSKADKEIEPSIALDGTIGPVAISALEAFRALSEKTFQDVFDRLWAGDQTTLIDPNLDSGFEPKVHANVLITILMAGGLNSALKPDDTLGEEFQNALDTLKAMPDDDLRKGILNNILIHALFGGGYNHENLKPDGTLGEKFDTALQELRDALAETK